MTVDEFIASLTRRLVWFDLETTGVNVETARIKQIAMVVFEPGKAPVKYKSLVHPEVAIPKGASDVTGITNEIIQYGCAYCHVVADEHPHGSCEKWKPVPKFRDMAPKLLMGFRDADFGGHNVVYDLRVIRAEFKRLDVEFDYYNAKVVDTLRLWQHKEPRTLSAAYEKFVGKALDGAHDAQIDIDATIEIFFGQLETWSDLPTTMNELNEICYPRDPNWIDREGKFIFIEGVPCLNFGKSKGEPMRANRGFLAWMLKQDFALDTKAIAKQGLDGIFPIQYGDPT